MRPSIAVISICGKNSASVWAPALISRIGNVNFEQDLPEFFSVFDARIVVSSEMPVVHGTTVAVHIRRGDDDDLYVTKQVERGTSYGGESTTPFLSVARIAKELGVWPGAHCYYCAQIGKKKFLALEDSLLFTLPPDFHAGEKYILITFNLLLLGLLTNRVVLLPAIIQFEKFFYATEYFDYPEQAPIRESNFFRLATRRDDTWSQTTSARIILRADGSVGISSNDQQDVWYAADLDTFAYDPLMNKDNHLRKRILVAAANEHPSAASADILFLDIDSTKNNELIFPELACFYRYTFSGRLCSQFRKVETWISSFWDQTEFCTPEARNLRFLNLISPSDDCRAKRIEDYRRAYIALLRNNVMK
eukprot:CAMPEP_0197325032 /NCGR_PEP_ID=MMETSP0891-20130614/71443_1 /TAXON_ID=44058 ORGANISM="Aureoumbra lagunensis, Strain CCMP1510" /NCGR_SAMPLE_ID=MMETSP0891 /ASSEMBLY_ACC=CAM_ASM_000534 /LENGTH=362 /DNA_ID=CAMNT_0042817929 /DNA_START=697 /DNA_END=1785 /DNA_ORIENTATION=+